MRVCLLLLALVGVAMAASSEVQCGTGNSQVEEACQSTCQRYGFEQGGQCSQQDGYCHCQGQSSKATKNTMRFVKASESAKQQGRRQKRLFWGPDYPDYFCDPDECANICFEGHPYCEESYCDYTEGCTCGGPIETC